MRTVDRRVRRRVCHRPRILTSWNASALAGLAGGHRTLDDLVEFVAIKPYATTFRAIVDLDPFTARNHQHGLRTNRAIHGLAPLPSSGLVRRFDVYVRRTSETNVYSHAIRFRCSTSAAFPRYRSAFAAHRTPSRATALATYACVMSDHIAATRAPRSAFVYRFGGFALLIWATATTGCYERVISSKGLGGATTATAKPNLTKPSDSDPWGKSSSSMWSKPATTPSKR